MNAWLKFSLMENPIFEHLYLNDYDTHKPIGVVLDYQASLSPLVSFQVNDYVKGYNTLNFLNTHYVKHPLGLKDVIDEFCNYHEHRTCKHVYYFYDHTAVTRATVCQAMQRK